MKPSIYVRQLKGRIMDKINSEFGHGEATCTDSATIAVFTKRPLFTRSTSLPTGGYITMWSVKKAEQYLGMKGD